MPTPDLARLLEAVSQLSVEIMFALLIHRIVKTFGDVVFSLDLMIILLTLLVQRVVAKHLTIRPMGRALGYGLYYSERQIRRIEHVFLRGLEAERERAAQRPGAPPEGRFWQPLE